VQQAVSEHSGCREQESNGLVAMEEAALSLAARFALLLNVVRLESGFHLGDQLSALVLDL
jgi:hypothetical protein